jgi:hypothetical protein
MLDKTEFAAPIAIAFGFTFASMNNAGLSISTAVGDTALALGWSVLGCLVIASLSRVWAIFRHADASGAATHEPLFVVGKIGISPRDFEKQVAKLRIRGQFRRCSGFIRARQKVHRRQWH